MTAYNYDAGPGSGQQFLVLGSLPSPWSGARGTGDWPGPDKLPAWPRLCVAIKSRFYKNSWTWKRRLTARPSLLQTGFHIFIVWYGLFGVEGGFKTRIKVLCAPVFIVPETLNIFRHIIIQNLVLFWDMTGIFHACLEFMNRKIGLIPFLAAFCVNKHVKNSLVWQDWRVCEWVCPAGLVEGQKPQARQ